LKKALIGPLGAMGDQLFWATIKPAVGILAVLLIMILQNLQTQLIFLLVLLILYNVPHLYIRWIGLVEGYKEGFNIYRRVKIEHFLRLKNIFLFCGALALGILIGFYANNNLTEDLFGLVVFVVSFITVIYIRYSKTRVYRTILIPLLISIILGLIVTVI